MTTTTRSRRSADGVAIPGAAELKRLKLSLEVAWYLGSRGIPLPTCPPKFKTPEPRSLPGAKFDADRVDRVLKVFRRLRHTKGRWAGKPLNPDPWQIAYVLAPVYGWVRKNDAGEWVRIARQEYVEVGRKNGKTTLAGGQAIYLTTADGENGAEVYAVAAAKDQARFTFDPIRHLAERSPDLAPHVRALASRIVHDRSGSAFVVVSSAADLLMGGNVHGAVIDELHIHKTADLVEAVESGTGAREQPLVIIITTADDGRPGTIYDRKRTYVEQLARGVFADPSVYGVVFAADDDDDPFDEATWRKANPGFGISPSREYMEQMATKAKNSPADLAKFRRLHLGLRTKQRTKYIELAAWDANAGIVDADALAGRRAFGGLDLAATSDLCAWCLLFPDDDGGYDALWRHWLPEDALPVLNQRTAGEAEVWVRQGWLTLTPGNVTDYGRVRADINADRERFAIVEAAYDVWNSSQLVNDLTGDGLETVPTRQGYATLSAPTKELQRLVLSGRPERPVIRHGGNPLMRWEIDNLAVTMDAAENVKPDKKHSGDKIDGIAALVNALDRAMRQQPEAETPAYYSMNRLLGGE